MLGKEARATFIGQEGGKGGGELNFCTINKKINYLFQLLLLDLE